MYKKYFRHINSTFFIDDIIFFIKCIFLMSVWLPDPRDDGIRNGKVGFLGKLRSSSPSTNSDRHMGHSSPNKREGVCAEAGLKFIWYLFKKIYQLTSQFTVYLYKRFTYTTIFNMDSFISLLEPSQILTGSTPF